MKATKKRKVSSSHSETAKQRRQAAFLEAYITCGTITLPRRGANRAELLQRHAGPPRNKTRAVRWHYIAEFVPGRSKKDVIRRYRETD